MKESINNFLTFVNRKIFLGPWKR